MIRSTQIKEEFYIRRLFDDDVPMFVDVTKFVRQDHPYPLSAKKSLKATCGVRTDDEVVAFSLRIYTSKQAEKEVENLASEDDGPAAARNVLRPRMPRKTLHTLRDSARALSVILGEDIVVRLDDALYVLALDRSGGRGTLRPVARLAEADGGYTRSNLDDDVEFELPVTGVRLHIFLRSPVRERILAYAFSGYLTRKPGEFETVTRATALALNSVLGLATFRMLSGLEHVHVPPLSPAAAIRRRPPEEQVTFSVPVLLFTEDGVPAARGHIAVEMDLDHLEPVTGEPRFHLAPGDDLEWNPAVAGTVEFADYERVLGETVATMVQSALGKETVRDVAYDIMLSDLSPERVAALRASTTGLPGLAAKPGTAEVRQAQPSGTDVRQAQPA